MTLDLAHAEEISARMLHFYIEKNNDKNDSQLFLQWKGCYFAFLFYFLWPKAVHSSDHTQLTFAHVWIRLEGKWQKKKKNGSVSVNKMFGPSPSMVWLPDTDTFHRLQLDVWQKFKGFGKGSIWVSAKLTPLETRIFLLGWDSTV